MPKTVCYATSGLPHDNAITSIHARSRILFPSAVRRILTEGTTKRNVEWSGDLKRRREMALNGIEGQQEPLIQSSVRRVLLVTSGHVGNNLFFRRRSPS